MAGVNRDRLDMELATLKGWKSLTHRDNVLWGQPPEGHVDEYGVTSDPDARDPWKRVPNWSGSATLALGLALEHKIEIVPRANDVICKWTAPKGRKLHRERYWSGKYRVKAATRGICVAVILQLEQGEPT
jgi:hypothetical protein